MKISFLVTYYNQEKFVKDSMESILAINKPFDWEILVGDDGSTDGTAEEVKKYIEQYPEHIKLFVMPRDNSKKYDSVLRASANRLNLLENATGDYFCTLDGDDFYCDKNFVKKAIDIFKSHKDVSIVAFGYKNICAGKEDDCHIFPEKLNEAVVDTRKYLSNLSTLAGACVHTLNWDSNRIDFIKETGFFDDNDIVINSLNYGKMYVVNNVVYAYRQEQASIYHKMSILEQAVLNTQGFDVDRLLVDENYYENLVERYGSAILDMYLRRGQLRKVLGTEKINRYRSGCERINGSLALKIIDFETLNRKERTSVKKVIRLIMKKKPKQYIKIKLLSLLGK